MDKLKMIAAFGLVAGSLLIRRRDDIGGGR